MVDAAMAFGEALRYLNVQSPRKFDLTGQVLSPPYGQSIWKRVVLPEILSSHAVRCPTGNSVSHQLVEAPPDQSYRSWPTILPRRPKINCHPGRVQTQT